MRHIFDTQNANTLFVRLRNTGTGSFTVTKVSLKVEVDTTEYVGEGKTVIAKLGRNQQAITDLNNKFDPKTVNIGKL